MTNVDDKVKRMMKWETLQIVNLLFIKHIYFCCIWSGCSCNFLQAAKKFSEACKMTSNIRVTLTMITVSFKQIIISRHSMAYYAMASENHHKI